MSNIKPLAIKAAKYMTSGLYVLFSTAVLAGGFVFIIVFNFWYQYQVYDISAHRAFRVEDLYHGAIMMSPLALWAVLMFALVFWIPDMVRGRFCKQA